MNTPGGLTALEWLDPEAELGHKEPINITDELLRGYPMQWALDRKLYITNINQHISVNAYKLATQSTAFNELLYIASRSFSATKSIHVENKDMAISAPILRVTYEENETNLLDLMFAIHCCHLGNFQITGITLNGSTEKEMITKQDDEKNICGNTEMSITRFEAKCCLKAGIRISAMYGLTKLREACHRYTISIISHENCWELWDLATFTKGNQNVLFTTDREFANIVQDYILINFTKLLYQQIPSREGQFKCLEDLEIVQMEYILRSERLNLRREKHVIEAIKRWLEHRTGVDRVEISKLASRLIVNCVRIKQLELEDIELLYMLPILKTRKRLLSTRNGWIKTIQQRKNTTTIPRSHIDYMSQVRQVRRRLFRTHRNLRPLKHERSGLRADISSYPMNVTDARLPHEAIFVFGGWRNGGPSRDVNVLDSRRKAWIHYGPVQNARDQSNSATHPIVLPDALMSFGIAMIQNRYIIIAGGEYSNATTSSAVIKYDAKTVNKCGCGWKKLPPLQESRRDLALVQMDDRFLYAIGGDDNNIVSNLVECLELNVDGTHDDRGWRRMQNMLISRAAAAADCLNQMIYVCGGYTESHMEGLTNTCEVYCPTTNQWTFIQPMAQPRYYGQAVTVQGQLFVLGGGGECGIRGATRMIETAGYSSTVERYNPENSTWELMPPMSERADFAACYFEERLISMGGGGETFCIDDVEQWKPWIANNNPGVVSHISYQNGFDYARTSTAIGPVWLNTHLRSYGQKQRGWDKYVNLPYPTWGHRCVVLKGSDLILPYLARNIPHYYKQRDEPTLCDIIARPIVTDSASELHVPGTQERSRMVEIKEN